MAVVADMNNMGSSIHSSSTFHPPKSHYVFPSPPPEIKHLANSADTPCCRPSRTHPCHNWDSFDSADHPREEDPPSASRPPTSVPKQDPPLEAGTIYLSPPPTGSQPNIPLPEDADCTTSTFKVLEAGGILDSPRVMRDVSRSHTPISPPPTIPTTTQALPEPKHDHTDHDVLMLESDIVDPFESESHADSRDHDDQATVEGAIAHDGVRGSLLSPLSPEWSSCISNLTTAERQTEPPSLTFQKGYRDSVYDDSASLRPSSEDSDLGFRLHDTFRLSPESPVRTVGNLSMDTGMSVRSSNPGDPGSGNDINNMLIFSEPSAISNLDEEPPSWQPGHWPSTDHDHHMASPPLHLLPSMDDSQSCVSSFPGSDSEPYTRPSIEPLTIPYTSDTPTHSEHGSPLSYLHSDWHSDWHGEGYDNYSSSPSSNLLQPIDSDLSLHDVTDLLTPNDDKSLPLPSSPLTSFPSSLYDFQDDMNFPIASPSPSRRSFSSLPELEDDDDVPFRSPSSPTLLSLPGGDTDDDLLPAFADDDFPPPEVYPLTPIPSMGLLLIDDPNDVPAPRSPSPDDFDIDLDLDETVYPEFEQLCELRKKALSAERAARHLETHLLEQGDIASRAETRRQRKGEKERSKEIGALLRLKLGNDKVAILQGEEKKPKKMATSLPRLVAKMVFRRHDTNRPIRNRKLPGSPEYNYVRSPLSRSVFPYSIGEDVTDG